MTQPGKYMWLHINNRTLKEVQAIVTDGEVMTDGDCGNIWGEHHNCPWPHILVKFPSAEDIQALKESNVGYAANEADVWADVSESWLWTEDSHCYGRTDWSVDYRRPFGTESPDPETTV